MPIEHVVDPETGIMHVRRWGKIKTCDEDRALRKRREDPLVVPGIPVIVDCREVDPPDTTHLTNHIADRISALAEKLNCGPVAIVVSSEVQYGMARMFMGLTALTHPDTEVFRNYEEALDWLHRQSIASYQTADDL